MQQRHEVRREAKDRLGPQQVIVPRELARCPNIIKGARVIGATDPVAWRLVITPGGFVAEHDFHCTSDKSYTAPRQG